MNAFAALLIVTLLFVSGFAYSQIPSKTSDSAVIKQDREAKSNYKMDFFFYFPHKENAERVAEHLRTENYTTVVRPAATGTEFVLIATKNVISSEETLTDIDDKMDIWAKSENGLYDGSGAEVVQ